MKHRRTVVILALVLLLSGVGMASADYVYKAHKEHLGGNVTPVEAYKMVKDNPEHTFLIDCRTRAEYQFVGHAKDSYNIPVKFLTTKAGEKGYNLEENPNFEQDLLARFNPETDTLLIFCRSGSRSCMGCNRAVKAGFAEERVFNIMGGFEGDKNKNPDSTFCGQRWGGGWKNEGLPWTYSMDADHMYKADLE